MQPDRKSRSPDRRRAEMSGTTRNGVAEDRRVALGQRVGTTPAWYWAEGTLARLPATAAVKGSGQPLPQPAAQEAAWILEVHRNERPCSSRVLRFAVPVHRSASCSTDAGHERVRRRESAEEIPKTRSRRRSSPDENWIVMPVSAAIGNRLSYAFLVDSYRTGHRRGRPTNWLRRWLGGRRLRSARR